MEALAPVVRIGERFEPKAELWEYLENARKRLPESAFEETLLAVLRHYEDEELLYPPPAAAEPRLIEPETPPASAPPQPDFAEMVENELDELTPGNILFNPSEEMKVGVTERVEARIAKSDTAEFTLTLKGRGEPQIERISVGTCMAVRLTGAKFDIESLSHEEQLVADDRFTQWEWDVTPLKRGVHSLFLGVTVRIKIPDYGEEKKDFPVLEKKIKVTVNPIYSTHEFMGDHWEWIIGALMGSGAIGWGIKRFRRSSKPS
jgi:hypothetical protein